VTDDRQWQFYALYLTRFAGGFGVITLVTLLPEYIDVLDPSATTVLGVTLGAGIVIGLFTTGFTLAQTVAIVPLAWAGDRGDKRLVLVGSLALGVLAYAGFVLVDSSATFIAARALQGVAVTGAGLMSLSLVGELAEPGERANHIGRANAARFAASILGSLAAGALYEAFGFGPPFLLIVVLLSAATVAVRLSVDRDTTVVPGFPFTGLAVNRRILAVTTFRAPYAVAVTLVRTWVPIYAGVSLARGGLAYGALAVGATVVAEKLCNMLLQPRTGRLSDGHGRALFVLAGGTAYGLVALAVPSAPLVGAALSLPTALPVVGEVSAAFLPLVALSGLLGVADAFREPASMALFADEGTGEGVASSFGIRELVWRPGSVAAPLLGGYLMTDVGMAWVFYVGGAAALVGALAFLASLVRLNGAGAVTEW
jgi:MFS family permease